MTPEVKAAIASLREVATWHKRYSKNLKRAAELTLVLDALESKSLAVAKIEEERAARAAAGVVHGPTTYAEMPAGQLVIAGNITIEGEGEVQGLFIQMTEDELRGVKYLPMYQRVRVVADIIAP